MPDQARRSNTPDVLVIGGGVAGLGVAWRCAQRGLSVIVADPAPGRGASHVAAGMIAPASEATYGEERLLRLTLQSAARWPSFADELEEAAGSSIGRRTEGTVAVAFDADDNRALEDLYRFQQALDLPVERLTSAAVRELEPAVSPRVRGGVLVRGEWQVENRATVAALVAACERRGVVFDGRPVSAVTVESGVATGAVLAGDPVGAGVVVVAAGAWAGRLDGLPPEARPPVRPVKGQILRLRTSDGAPFLTRTVWGRAEGREVYVVPRSDGEVVVGGTVEEQGFDTDVTGEAVRLMLASAFAVVPSTDDLAFVEASAGLRPGTPDNAPILGATPVERLVMCTGHYRHGFELLPVTADEVAAVAAGGVSDVIEPFSIDRFTPAQARS